MFLSRAVPSSGLLAATSMVPAPPRVSRPQAHTGMTSPVLPSVLNLPLPFVVAALPSLTDAALMQLEPLSIVVTIGEAEVMRDPALGSEVKKTRPCVVLSLTN